MSGLSSVWAPGPGDTSGYSTAPVDGLRPRIGLPLTGVETGDAGLERALPDLVG
jgi:hypothetical protein